MNPLSVSRYVPPEYIEETPDGTYDRVVGHNGGNTHGPFPSFEVLWDYIQDKPRNPTEVEPVDPPEIPEGTFIPVDPEDPDSTPLPEEQVEPGNQITEWSQDTEGNCGAVGIIKGAIAKFRFNIFKDIEKTGDGWRITLHDGNVVEVSEAEFKLAMEKAGLKGMDPDNLTGEEVLAILAYTVIAKGVAADKGISLGQAMDSVNNGATEEGVHQFLDFLGLEKHYQVVDPNTQEGKDVIEQEGNAVIGEFGPNGGGHVYYVHVDENGQWWADEWGTPDEWGGDDESAIEGGEAQFAIVFTDPGMSATMPNQRPEYI